MFTSFFLSPFKNLYLEAKGQGIGSVTGKDRVSQRTFRRAAGASSINWRTVGKEIVT
jgi:hypothetical protein